MTYLYFAPYVLLWNLGVLLSIFGLGYFFKSGLVCIPGLKYSMGSCFGLGTIGVVGISFFLVLVSIFIPFGFANRILMVVLYCVGLLGFGYLVKAKARESLFWWHLLVSLLVFVFLFFVCIPTSILQNTNDDYIGYFPLVERLLINGDLIDPFNSRRVGAFGGHIALQAFSMLGGSDATGYVLDFVLIPTFLVALLLELTRSLPKDFVSYAFRVVLIGSVVFYPFPSVNTASTMSSLYFLVGLLYFLSRLRNSSEGFPLLASLLLVCLVAAGACSIRPTTLIFAAGSCLAFFLAWGIADRSNLWKILAVAFQVAGGVLILLVPWMIALYQSSGTFSYPPFPGNLNPAFLEIGDPRGKLYDLIYAVKFFGSLVMLPSILLLAALYFSLPDSSKFPIFLLLVLTFLGSFVIAFGFGSALESEIYRYIYPGLGAIVFWMSVLFLNKLNKTILGNTVLIVSVFILFVFSWGPITRGFNKILFVPSLISIYIFGPLGPPVLNEVAASQNLTPPGSKLFLVNETPSFFDFSRNVINPVDIIGAASPGGLLPIGAGPLVLEAYLVGQGYDFILADDFDNARYLYSRKLWENHPRKEKYFTDVWGRNALLFMKEVDALAAMRETQITPSGIRVIPLFQSIPAL